MARPITWQDVAAPNQTGNLAAAAAATEQLQRSLTGLGGVATGVRNVIREDATRNAVADIAASADPTAALAAAPQGWQVDALALSQAANARTNQLQDLQQGAAQIAASNASVKASESAVLTQDQQRQDLIDRRLGAELAQPYLNDVNAGKYKGVPKDAFAGKGQGGIYAQEAIQRAIREREDLTLRQTAANVAAKRLAEDQAKEDYAGWARDFGASAEGQALDPAERDRRLTAEAKRRGISAIYVDPALKLFEQGATANTATQGELRTPVAGVDLKVKDPETNTERPITYQDLNSVLTRQQTRLEREKAGAVSKFDRAVRGQELNDGTVFKGPEQGFPNQLAESLGWSESDAREAIDAVKAEYPGIKAHQAADIVLATKGKWFEGRAARSPQAVAMANSFKEFNDIGGTEGLTREINKVSAPFDVQLQKLPVLARQTTAAARSGRDIPKGVLTLAQEFQKADTAAEKEAAKAQKLADEAVAKAAADAARREKERLAVRATGAYGGFSN